MQESSRHAAVGMGSEKRLIDRHSQMAGEGSDCHEKRLLNMAKKTYKQLGCLDVDPKGGCAFMVRAETEDEVMRLTGDHAKVAHNMASPPPDMVSKIKAAIRTVTVDA